MINLLVKERNNTVDEVKYKIQNYENDINNLRFENNNYYNTKNNLEQTFIYKKSIISKGEYDK